VRQDDPRHEHENRHAPGNRRQDFNLNEALDKKNASFCASLSRENISRILEALKAANDIHIRVKV
jgi:hypothetical protein